METVLVTGGSGFIGSAVIRQFIECTNKKIINVDTLTYAASMESLADLEKNKKYNFEKRDICDAFAMARIFEKYKPDQVIHLAAESHVDRSIGRPLEFIHTNVVGTATLLNVAKNYCKKLSKLKRQKFRFLHVSTDEVYGDLTDTGYFTEDNPYKPSSPYSASKAAADHLVRAWHRTYDLPTIITNCSNNYGHYQFPEKLIPLIIINALQGKPLPIYGNGEQIRDWLYVEDHARALRLVLEKGRVGETYNIGGNNEKKNLEVVELICTHLDELIPNSAHKPHFKLVKFVTDRAGHDVRYAVNSNKIQAELGWKPDVPFETGLRQTITWYLENFQRSKKALSN